MDITIPHPSVINQEALVLNKTDFSKNLLRSTMQQMKKNEANTLVSHFTYEIDGHSVEGFVLAPKRRKGQLPAIIYNRGGFKDFARISPLLLYTTLAEMAQWGYIVIASQYRHDDEFGGQDLHDVLHLRTLLRSMTAVAQKKIGMFGASRGGMMTYQILSRTKWVRSAVILSGVTNLFRAMELRPETKTMFRNAFGANVAELKKRSAVYWPEKINSTTDLLILHGLADKRTSPLDALELSEKLCLHNKPHRLIMFERGDHYLLSHEEEMMHILKNWFAQTLA